MKVRGGSRGGRRDLQDCGFVCPDDLSSQQRQQVVCLAGSDYNFFAVVIVWRQPLTSIEACMASGADRGGCHGRAAIVCRRTGPTHRTMKCPESATAIGEVVDESRARRNLGVFG